MIRFILNGLDIPEVEAEIAITLQAFSFTELGTRKGSFSNVFEIPKTNEVRAALENAEIIISATAIPYQLNRVQIIKDGVLIVDGTAILQDVKEAYRVFISAGNSDYFKGIRGLKLTDVDLADLDHIWNATNVTARRETREGFVYPNIDYGFFEWADPAAELYPFYFFQPSLWAKTIIERATAALGYTLRGALLETLTYQNLVVLCSGAKPDLLSSLAQYKQTIDYGQLTEATAEPISFSERISDISELYTFNAGAQQFTYAPNVEDRTLVSFAISVTGKVITNLPQQYTNALVFVDLLIYDEDDNLLLTLSRSVQFENRFFGLFNVYRAPASGTLERDINFSYPSTRDDLAAFAALLAATPDLRTLRLGWQVRSNRPAAGLGRLRFEDLEFSINLLPTGGGRFALPTVPVTVRAAEVLPAAPTVADLLLTCANLEGIILQVDETEKTINTARLDDIISRKGEAADWGDKLDLSEEPEILYRIGGLSQVNFLLFTGDDKDPLLPDNLGRGRLDVNDANLPTEGEIFKSAFGPVPVLSTLSGARTMGRVFTGSKYTFDGFDFNLNEDLTVADFSPRVAILSEEGATLDIIEGANEINFEVNQTALDFQRSLANHWRLLRAVTERTKIVRALFLLDLEDIRAVDFTRPVYVAYFGEYFYIQRIEQFKINQRESCMVTLVRI